jgi:hypothetical protein
MTMKTITAQDFSTTELVEALTARGYFVRTLSHLDAMNEAIAAERERAAAELAVLTARMEAAIAEACAEVRARTIEECVAAALTHTTAPGLALSEPGADPMQTALARMIHRAVTAVVDTLRALATPTPTTEPAPVDPAAGALR